MQTPFSVIRWIWLFLLLGISNASLAQDLIQSRTNSPLTYIYRLEDREALLFLRKGLQDDASRYLHTLVDSFPTDSVYSAKLAPGYYIQTYADRNRQRFAITAVHNFEVMVVDNMQDLMLRVYNLEGQIISDAQVKVGGRNLRFDDQRQAYVQRRSNRQGWVSVSYQGRTAYFDLDRKKNNPAILRTTRQVLYETPLVYAWIPIHFTLRLPYDTYLSIRHRWARGTVRQMNQFFVRGFENIACLFDSYYCDGNYNRFHYRHNGYFVFNKPKYQPGDTAMFKAFIVNQKGRPANRDVDVILSKPRGEVNLGQISPYQPGGYSFNFVLHDSLELLLDRNYRISLEVKEDKPYMQGTFRYEDYDLSLLRLNLRTLAEEQYHGRPFPVFVKATDENDLHIPDGRLEISLRTLQVNDFFDQTIFVPDTLWKHNLELEFNRETDILIPDSVFPAANLRYELIVRLLTSSNETLTEKRQFHYYHKRYDISYEAHADSISFSYQENGLDRDMHITVSGKDNFGNLTLLAEGESPQTILIEPYFASYEVTSEPISKSIPLSSINAQLRFFAERNNRELIFRADNPRNLPFSYQLYKRNRLKKQGYQHEAEILHRTRSKKNYFVSVQYLWGGRMVEQTYRVPLRQNMLTIEVEQPSIIYPGQETEIELRIRDVDGKPVQGVDITAYGLTSKFRYNPPSVPVMEKQRRNQLFVNSFRVSERQSGRVRFSELDFPFWATARGLDSIEYFRFIYPEGLYRFEYDAPEGIAQFAPFVMKEGKPIPIHVLYVDGRPVYFSWITHDQPWSFRVAPGRRQIRIRTSEHDILLNDLMITEGKKLIFSLDADHYNPAWEIRQAEAQLSIREITSLRNFVFPYRQQSDNPFSFLETRDEVIWLKPASANVRRGWMLAAGPVSGKVVYNNLRGNYQLEFEHEPFFEYEFSPRILKMRSVEQHAVIPSRFSDRQVRTALADEVITRRMLEHMHYQWELSNQRTQLFRLNANHDRGLGSRLLLGMELLTDTLTPEFVLLIPHNREWDFRLFPGFVTNIFHLQPGTYTLIFLLKNNRYFIEEDVRIRTGGLNYLRIDPPDQLLTHEPIVSYVQLVNEMIAKRIVVEESQPEPEVVAPAPSELSVYSGPGITVRGQVVCAIDGNPLPGVTLWVKDTETGTVTDMDGYYHLIVPPGKHWIRVSFVGYNTQELDIRIDDLSMIYLEPAIMALDEVVVTGYGINRSATSMSLTGSVTTTDALQGIVAGVQISGSPGEEIRIRGASSISAEELSAPLIVINGIPFFGDFNDLSPDLIASMQVLKGAAAVGLYGSRAAGGVVIITTSDGFKDTAMGQMLSQSFEVPEFAGHSNRLRENFRDYAFWQPQLRSDKEGRARFAVTFPDDITSWETFYLAMNGRKQSGQTRGVIRSYLPLSAQLALPRFLVQSDTVHAIGKIFNYTPDSAHIQARFRIDGQEVFLRNHHMLHSVIDTLTIIAHTADSLEIGYTLERADGYFDGEQRDLGVYLPGIPQVDGTFHVLDSDTLINLAFDPEKGSVHLYARADLLDVLEEEAIHVLNFRYLCNEQIASKLKSLLALKQISELRGSPFRQEREISRLVRMLERNQRSRGKWGWWQGSQLSPWISSYVLEALWKAEQQGYNSGMDFTLITADWIWELDYARTPGQKLNILHLLKNMGATIAYETYIQEIEAVDSLPLGQWLQLIQLKQLCELPNTLDTLENFRQETLFGNVFFSDGKPTFTLLENEIQHTLQVYQILKRDEADHEELMRKIRYYFLEKRGQGHWRNTFESARIIDLLIAESFPQGVDAARPVVQLSGDFEAVVEEFPYQAILEDVQQLGVAMQGAFPVYFTAYQRWQNQQPQRKANEFSIQTRFGDGHATTRLSAGEVVTLTAQVRVEKDAEYTMIVIPIPAGCSFTSNRPRLRWEVHREYYRNEVVIFCERLPKGEYAFEVELMARYAGNFTLNPARIELMYFPTFNAHEGMKRIVVE
ncbi:MAG: carboxypeptidase-like regulatory domain-containing protein [Bacteroidales bacterium]